MRRDSDDNSEGIVAIDRFQPVDTLSNNFSAIIRAGDMDGTDISGMDASSGAITQILGLEMVRRRAPKREQARSSSPVAVPKAAALPAALFVIDGPGCGNAFYLTEPLTTIGRGDGQAIQIDFGDGCISRVGHAVIVYDSVMKQLIVRDGAKATPVYLNGCAIRGDRHLHFGDRLTLGQTTLILSAHQPD